MAWRKKQLVQPSIFRCAKMRSGSRLH